jgi:hypothetical protein
LLFSYAEVAIHHLMVNRETLHPGDESGLCVSRSREMLPRNMRFEMDMTLAQRAVAFVAFVFLFLLVCFAWTAVRSV